MIYKALAATIMGAVLSSSKKQVMEVAKSQIMQAQEEGARKYLLAHVAKKYTEEAEYNFSQYIRALGQATVDLEYRGKPGEAFISRAEWAVEELEGYVEAQNPDGAVIQFLQRRYKEEGIQIISGRLYGGHYINRKSQGTYEILNKMGYASAVDAKKPWLSGTKTTEGIEKMLADAAIEIFNVMFEDIDLSSELAGLKFSGGAGAEIAEKQTGSGGGGGGFATKPLPRKRKRKR